MHVDALTRSASRFGEAALDPALWPDILQDVAGSLGALGAVLLQSGTPSGGMPWSPALARQRETYYREGWNTRDLRAARSVSAFGRGLIVVTDEDLVSRDELAREPYFNSFLASHGTEAFAAVRFDLSSSEICGLVVQRTPSQGAFSAREKRALACLSPRLTASAELARLLGAASLRGSLKTLGDIGRPALALRRGGAVVGVNDAAAALFDEDLRVRAGVLAVRDPAAAFEIRKACEAARSTEALPGPAPRTVAVRREGCLPLLLTMVPLDGPAGSFVLGAGLLVTITDPTAPPAVAPDLLRGLFGLTRAEVRLCLQLAEGLSLKGAAEASDIAVETARSQLKAVFAKTGTRRQAELVAFLGRMGR